MTEKEDIFETIEAFVEGKLKREEQIAFEQKCLKSPELSAAVEEYRLLKRGMEEIGRKELRAKLTAWDKAVVQKERVAISVFKIAAAVFCFAVIGLSLALILNNNHQARSNIVQGYFNPYPNVTGERNTGQSSTIDSMLKLYDKGKYSEVINEFEKNDEALSTDDASLMLFYLGESLLAAGEYQRAAEVLETFNLREHALYEVARFHRALALILAGDDEKAIRALYIIHAEKGPYREKAKELLKYFADWHGTDGADMPRE